MQSLRSLLVPAVLTTWMFHASGLLAQDPTPREPSSNAPRAESPTTKEPAGLEPATRPEARGPRRRGGRSGMVVIEAGMVHPVSGPPIKDGVVLIRGERIFAIGLQGDLELPPNTKVYRFPNGHVYPGLIDASTDAFTDAALQRDGSLNGGSVIADGLVWTDSRDDHLVEHGVTTAYVSVHSGSQLPGQGAIVRPRKDGFEVWEDHQQAALQLRMNTGQVASHALQRQAQLEAVDKLFEGLDTYREEQEKFDKELEKYNSDFEKYLAYHSKKNGKDKDAKKDDKAPAKDPEAKTEAAEADPEASGETRRGGRRGSGRPPRREPPKDGSAQAELTAEAFEEALATVMALVGQPSVATPESNAAANNQDPKPQGATPSGTKPTNGEKPGGSPETKPGAAAAKKDDGPKRPTYPKKPNEDLQKEALNEVLDGTLPLRVEAHRRDELMAALRLQREREVPLLVLEQAYGADSLTQQIALQGATVVLTDVLPGSLGVPGDTSNPYAKFDPTGLPKQLNEAGVPFAIAGGSARMSALLPMMAAAAIGRGLSEDAALRAITLTPAEILGIAKDTGSLTRNKFADVIVTDGPLFASDSRMLLVVAKGRTEYEAK